MSHDAIIFTYTNYTSCQSHVYYIIYLPTTTVTYIVYTYIQVYRSHAYRVAQCELLLPHRKACPSPKIRAFHVFRFFPSSEIIFHHRLRACRENRCDPNNLGGDSRLTKADLYDTRRFCSPRH